jgi:hypothetical protein
MNKLVVGNSILNTIVSAIMFSIVTIFTETKFKTIFLGLILLISSNAVLGYILSNNSDIGNNLFELSKNIYTKISNYLLSIK